MWLLIVVVLTIILSHDDTQDVLAFWNYILNQFILHIGF